MPWHEEGESGRLKGRSAPPVTHGAAGLGGGAARGTVGCSAADLVRGAAAAPLAVGAG